VISIKSTLIFVPIAVPALMYVRLKQFHRLNIAPDTSRIKEACPFWTGFLCFL
jgi:hypothetical protein